MDAPDTRAAKRPLDFPNIAQAFNGTAHDKRELLRKFLTSGKNLNDLEATFTAERSVEDQTEEVTEAMTIRQMQEAGFTALPGCNHCRALNPCALFTYPDSRTKIAAVTAKGGLPDPDAPNDFESMRFWCTKKLVKTARDTSTVKASVAARVQGQAALSVLCSSVGRSTVAVPDTQALLAQVGHTQASPGASSNDPAPKAKAKAKAGTRAKGSAASSGPGPAHGPQLCVISLPFLTSFFSLCSLQSPRCGDQKRSEQPEQPADGLQGPAPLCRRGEALAGHLQGALFLVHHVPWLHTHCLRACRTRASPSRCAGISDDAGFQTAVKATQETVRPS